MRAKSAKTITPEKALAPEHCSTTTPWLAAPGIVLSMLMNGAKIKEMQACFSVLYENLKIDGLFGQQTRAVVEKAQRQCRLPVTGECNSTDYKKLTTVRKGDRGDKVKRVQKLLTKAGFSVVSDGIFGPNTKSILQKFQVSRGLAADGIAGPKTLAALAKR